MSVRVARLTPTGMGAIATVAVMGRDAWSVVEDLFQLANGMKLEACPSPGSLHFGRFGSSHGDEVVLAHRPNASEPWFEIHCHGGREVVAWIIEQCQDRGATVVDWVELERRATQSWIRAAAAASLTRALTVTTATILLNQQHGALDRSLSAIRDSLTSGRTEDAKAALRQLQATAKVGLRLTEPFRVAIFGPPNVGKSSLINRIAGYERAVVSPWAGTTRELTTTLTALGGWPMEFYDSPGIRASDDKLETEGVRRGLAALRGQSFDLTIWMVDRSLPVDVPSDLSHQIDLIVANKCDLPAGEPLAASVPTVQLSALTGEGLPDLESWLIGRLVGGVPLASGVLFSHELVDAVSEALHGLDQGQLQRSQQVLDALLQPEKPQSSLHATEPGSRRPDRAT